MGIFNSSIPVEPEGPKGPPSSTFEAASIAQFWNSEFDPYAYSKVRALATYEESSFYESYDQAYKTNNFVFMCVEYLIAAILGDGYHFEGGAAKQVDDFMKLDRTESKLQMLIRDGIRFGNGMMDFGTAGKGIKTTRVLNPKDISIEIQDDPLKPKYGERLYDQGGKKLKEDYIFHLTMLEFPGKAYGMSILRPNIYFCQAIHDCGGDLFAAAKRIGYAPVDASLDLDQFKTEADKKTVIDNFKAMLEGVTSATNSYVHDRRHTLSLLAGNPGAGRILPINEMIEPWMAMCLRSFSMPLGAFLQQGANKATLQVQKQDCDASIALYRRSIANQVEMKLLPRIVGDNADIRMVWNKPSSSNAEVQSHMLVWKQLYDSGMISRECFLEQFDIKDLGTTFAPVAVPGGATGDLRPQRSPSPSNQKTNPNPPAEPKQVNG
ncbi:MAG: hypothetical protein WCK39_00120 [Methanomassiliicoccales archaeon]